MTSADAACARFEELAGIYPADLSKHLQNLRRHSVKTTIAEDHPATRAAPWSRVLVLEFPSWFSAQNRAYEEVSGVVPVDGLPRCISFGCSISRRRFNSCASWICGRGVGHHLGTTEPPDLRRANDNSDRRGSHMNLTI